MITLSPEDDLQSLGLSFKAKGWFKPIEITAQDLPQDQQLPGLDRCFDSEFITQWLARLLKQTQPELRIMSCCPVYVRYKPGRYCHVFYSLTVSNKVCGIESTYLLSGKAVNADRRSKLPSTHRIFRVPSQAASNHTSQPLNLIIGVFPDDLKIPQLRALIGQFRKPKTCSRSTMFPVDRQINKTASDANIYGSILSYRPERYCLIHRLSNSKDTRETTDVIRISHDRSQARHVWDTITCLSQTPGQPFTKKSSIVPKPLTFDPTIVCTRQRAIAASVLTHHLNQLQEHQYLEKAGHVAAVIHTHHQDHLPLRSTSDVLNSVDRSLQLVTDAEPEFTNLARNIMRALAQQTPLNNRRPTLLHGDFSTNQILCSKDELKVIDFSGVKGDPECDIGNFFARIRLQLCASSIHHAEAQFLSGYRRVTQRDLDSQMISWYCVAVQIKDSCVALKYLRRGWRETVERRLRLALYQLQDKSLVNHYSSNLEQVVRNY